MAIVTLSPTGTIIIPAEYLQEFALNSGSSLDIEQQGNRLIITPLVTTTTSTSQSSAGASLRYDICRKNLSQDILFRKGVGPRIQELLQKMEIRTNEDALYLLPHRYEDRRNLIPVSRLRADLGSIAVFTGTVTSADLVVTKNGRRVFEAVVSDSSGSILCKWFNANPLWMKRTWKAGRQGIFFGEVRQFGYQREVHHPEVEWLPEGASATDVLTRDPVNYGRIVPVYPLTDGLQQKALRRIMREVLLACLDSVESIVPPAIVPDGLLPPREALEYVHQPPQDAPLADLNSGSTLAHRSLAFDEFFFWELGLGLKKRGITLEAGIAFQVTHQYTRQLAHLLPFELTKAQRRVLTEIKQDMMAPHPMHRLVQGDVGSGKTLVALMAALVAVENGYQVAIMAPTEILAEQHWHTINHWCSQLNIATVLVTAGLKGKRRKEIFAQIAEGNAQIVIGTHAVIQDSVDFARLGLGIVDEQHRFGVLQRGVLKKKGTNPDILVMTATPIPRTLAMTLFGDLSLSVIDELPPGRTPVATSVFFESRRNQVYDMVREAVCQGRQAYLIYPLVDESVKLDLKAATQMAEHLQQDIFPGFRIGLLHGRMTPDEKEQVMGAFKGQEIDILVATTVIEVGIDVPNATVMVIEHAERFGLSQLHQLRGRVGRGVHSSRCILLTGGKLSESGERRLRVMETTNDGFKIAEADLEIRGPGDFLGTRQSGMPDFRVANILRDGALLEQARQAAYTLLTDDPDLNIPAHGLLRKELIRRWGQRLELATIG